VLALIRESFTLRGKVSPCRAPTAFVPDPTGPIKSSFRATGAARTPVLFREPCTHTHVYIYIFFCFARATCRLFCHPPASRQDDGGGFPRGTTRESPDATQVVTQSTSCRTRTENAGLHLQFAPQFLTVYNFIARSRDISRWKKMGKASPRLLNVSSSSGVELLRRRGSR